MALAERDYEVRMLNLDDICLEHINENGELLDETQPTDASNCPRNINNYIKSAKAPIADIIVYSTDHTPETAKFLGKFVKLAKHVSTNKNMQVVVMDRAVSFGNMHNRAIKAYAKGNSREDINAFSRDVDQKPYSFEAIQTQF